jgi:hypothetical protein
MASKYPPYVNAYGKIPDVFDCIKKAAVPPKFTIDFLHSVLGLKSSSYRAMIPLLKRLDFLDQASIPTNIYKEYREESQSKSILGQQIKKAYSELYMASEYAHKLNVDELSSKLKTLLGVGDDDKNLSPVIGTFQELVKLSTFGPVKVDKSVDKSIEVHEAKKDVPLKDSVKAIERETKFGISYTINLNLPATTEIEVYNAIFKSLKDNLLNE